MSEDKPSQNGAQVDAVAQLIQAAGRREEPPVEAYRRTLELATVTWQAKIRHRRQRWVGAIAAGLAAATIAAWLTVTWQSTPPQPIAHVERIIGTVDMRTAAAESWATLRDESHPLISGTTLRTREGSRVGIVMAGNVSLRLADQTEVAIDSASRIHLIAGKAYLDTGGRGEHRLELVTDTAVATNVFVRTEDGWRLWVHHASPVLSGGSDD